MNPALKKWWASYAFQTGQIIRTASPYRKDHITPFLKHLPESAKKKVTENFFDVTPALVFTFGLMYWADYEFDKEQRKHRS